jgi:hypothetical protein
MAFFRSVRRAASKGFHRIMVARELEAQRQIRAYLPDSVFRDVKHSGYGLGVEPHGDDRLT